MSAGDIVVAGAIIYAYYRFLRWLFYGADAKMNWVAKEIHPWIWWIKFKLGRCDSWMRDCYDSNLSLQNERNRELELAGKEDWVYYNDNDGEG